MSGFARAAVASTVLGAAAAGAQPNASIVSIHLTASSDFIQYGLSQTDGHSALRAGVDYEHRSGFVTGAWVANTEYPRERNLASARRAVTNLYAGFGRANEGWGWTAMVGRYIYSGGLFDYDYTTVGGSLSWRRRFVYSVSYGDNFYGGDVSTLDQEVTGYWPLRWNMSLSATFGRLAADSPVWNDGNHWNVGVSKIVRRFSIDLRMHNQDYDFYSFSGVPADRRWVLSLSAGFELD